MRMSWWFLILIVLVIMLIRCTSAPTGVPKYCYTLSEEAVQKDEICGYCYSPTGNITICPNPKKEY